jgi:hypothetical protein
MAMNSQEIRKGIFISIRQIRNIQFWRRTENCCRKKTSLEKGIEFQKIRPQGEILVLCFSVKKLTKHELEMNPCS